MKDQPGSMPDSIVQVIEPRARDLGGFEVRRLLPSAQCRTVGPFIFFDEVGPAVFPAGQGIDVRPHPHIGLATVTYLFEGEIMHRDSLGYSQAIRPGAVNWMTAGRGIVHSERTGDEERAREARIHGVQSWIALPLEQEEAAPGFYHHPADSLPVIEGAGHSMRLIAGTAFGQTAPVQVFSKMFYLDARIEAGAAVPLPADHDERAVYIVEGTVETAGRAFGPGRMVVFKRGAAAEITAQAASRVLLLGGETLAGKRHLWWNFVASSKERLERAKADWKAGRFPQVPGETEFIPLPED